MIIKWGFFGFYLYCVCSYKLITDKKIFSLRGNICQLKSEFYTQILILLKPSLLHVHLRSGAIAIL